MAAMTNRGASGSSQMATTRKGNALQSPTYHGASNAREIDNFFWNLETYFGVVGIMDEVQKVNTASFSLKDIALVWWHCRCDDVTQGSPLITTWGGFKKEPKE